VNHAAVRSDLAATAEYVVDRHFMQQLGDGFGLIGAGLVDRFQVLSDRRIGAGLHHVRHAAGPLHVFLGEGARFIVAVPIEALGQGQALRRLQAEAVHFGQSEEQGRHALAAGDDAELRRLLDRVAGVETGIGEADDLGAR